MHINSQYSNLQNVLIVDDSSDQIDEVRRILINYGCHLDLRHPKELSVDLLSSDPPNLIIINTILIDVNSCVVYSSLRKSLAIQNIPIAFWGELDDLDQTQAIQVCQHEFLSKSLQPLELCDHITRYLNPVYPKSAQTHTKFDLRSVETFNPATTQKLLDEIAANTPYSIVITDATSDLNIVYVNDAFEQMTGYQKHEVLGRSPKLLQGPKTDLSTTATIRASIQNSAPLKVKILNYKKNSDEIWVDVNLFPILETPKNVTHWVALSQDVTQKASDSVLLAKERELAKLRSQFILMMSHESRTHLSMILSSIDLLERYSHCVSASEKQDLYKHVRVAVDRLVGLFGDVLVLEQFAEDYISFKPAPLDLKNFCEKLVSEVRTIMTSEHQIRIVFDDEIGQILADESLLHHIFSNLLSNAVKYSPEGGIIEFDVSFSAKTVIFLIRDQGIGIPPDAMTHLFQSFFRADNVGYIAGTGLGLSIVKKMVEKHQGLIECESEVGVGTTFLVTIPRCEAIAENITVSANLPNLASL